MEMDARVYRSYLRKLQQQNKKSSLENQRLEKASEELNDCTHNIANGFCNWVQSIGGEDPQCNLTEEAILNWFAVGQDALEVEEKEKTFENGNDQRDVNNQTTVCSVKPATKNKISHNNTNRRSDKRLAMVDYNDSDDDLDKIELKKLELENKLKDMASISLLNEFRSRMGSDPPV